MPKFRKFSIGTIWHSISYQKSLLYATLTLKTDIFSDFLRNNEVLLTYELKFRKF